MKYVGITMGDPAGIGCEVTLKALQNEHLRKQSVVFGSIKVIEYYMSRLNIQFQINVMASFDEFIDGALNIMNVVDVDMKDVEIGQVSKISGNAAYQYIEKAIFYALQNKLIAVVTGPINKEALHLAGYNYAGHTEIFAHLTKTKNYSMMLYSDMLKTIHVSTHVSLRKACDLVTKERVLNVIQLAHDFLKQTGLQLPRIAVAGLNPHAGESGLFGHEEIEEIIPAIMMAQKRGLSVFGPEAPDTVFMKCMKGEYDIVVAMYHDQGHIPMKLLAFDSGVNITVGLPIIRTSVDHGTAFDITDQGIANSASMVKAIEVAMMLN